MRAHTLIRIAYGIGLAGLSLLLLWQQQDIRDWWFLRSYEPPQAIETLAERADMSETGRRYFYASDPRLHDDEAFNEHCTPLPESSVLGCYSSDSRIHILRVERQELEGIMTVTAAHEMLHAAYHRLPRGERDEVVELLETEFADIDDPEVISLIERYAERGGEEVRRDELHAVLPTQVEDLSAELEDYYGQYFRDRQEVIEWYQQYNSTFTQLREQIQAYEDRLENLRAQIERLEERLENQQARLERLNSQLEQREADGDIAGYNALVPQQNRAVETYNGLVESYRRRIDQHNRVVDELNETVLLEQDLFNSIDSTYESL